MVAGIPSLEGSLFLTDPQSIVAYVWRKYSRTPKDAVSILPDMIISLPYQVSQFSREPNVLVTNIQTDLQGVFTRIFDTERKVTVNVTQIPNGDNGYDISVSIMYATLEGELDQIGTTISIDRNGRLIIPEDTLNFNSLP